MPLPVPEPGLVISFNYLWRREFEEGRRLGRYARPCAIVIAHRRETDGSLMVVVAPITHQPPREGDEAVLIPPVVKRHLGLDAAPSWVMVDEINEFGWPGFDLEPNAKGEIAYGFMPPKLFGRIRDAIVACARTRRLKRTPR